MLTDLQTKKLTRYFQVYDVDDDGRIAQADFERIFENVRILRGEKDNASGYRSLRDIYMGLWDRLRSAADGDHDGGVDLDEWLAYWQLALEDDERFEAETQALTDRLLRVFDVDEDGTIGLNEFSDFYGVFGLAVSLAETVFAELDTDSDGLLTRSELLDISRQFYRSDDVEAPGNLLFGPIGV